MVNFSPVLLQTFQVARQQEGRNFLTIDDLRDLLGSELIDPAELVSVSKFLTGSYDAAADHTDWLLNAIQRVGVDYGGTCVGLLFPHPLYNISAKLSIPYDHITLIGRGQGVNRGTINAIRGSAATRILFKTGSTPAPMIEFAPNSGADWYLQGGGIKRIMLDGNNLATRCLSVLSARMLQFDGLHAFAGTEAMIFTGQIDGSLVHPVYGSAYHVWNRCAAHAATFTSNAAYALRMVGGRGDGGTTQDDSTINQFYSCQFTSQQQHAVSLESADGHDFYGGAMTSLGGGGALVGGLGTGFFGLELCSSSQSTGFGTGVARNNRFFGPQINDTIIRAGQSGGNSPHEIEFYGQQYGNAGGFIFVETPAGGSPAPHAIVYDQMNGITVYGNSVHQYQLHGMDRVHFIEDVVTPAAETGYAKFWIDTSKNPRLRLGSGTLKTLVTVDSTLLDISGFGIGSPAGESVTPMFPTGGRCRTALRMAPTPLLAQPPRATFVRSMFPAT